MSSERAASTLTQQAISWAWRPVTFERPFWHSWKINLNVLYCIGRCSDFVDLGTPVSCSLLQLEWLYSSIYLSGEDGRGDSCLLIKCPIQVGRILVRACMFDDMSYKLFSMENIGCTLRCDVGLIFEVC